MICLKISQIVDWTWTTVLCLLYLVMVFAVVGLISLGTGLVMKSIRACKNEATRKELFLITTVWLYLSLQVASAVLGYLGVGGTLLISQYNTETGETKSTDQPRHIIQNVNVILCLVVMGLQLVWLVPRCIWRRKLGDLFSFMFLQFVDPRILEMKTQDLKIKINYPLFLKKSKSNMFQKAIREDFESQGLKKDRKSGASTSTQHVETPGVLKNSDNIKMSEKLKEQRRKLDVVGGGTVMQAQANPSTVKENILSSGGFYSSRGGDRQTLNYSTEFNRGNRFALGKKDQQMIKEHFDTGEDLEEGQKPTKQSRRILVQSARMKSFDTGDGDLNIEVFKEPDCGLVNKILLKNLEDVEEPIEAGKSTKRDKFEITKYNEKEATERFKSTARDKNDDEDGLCVICFTNIPNAVFLDCGHGGVCIDCSIDSMKRNNSCLLCRKLVVQILEIESLKETDGLFKVLNSFYVSTFHKK